MAELSKRRPTTRTYSRAYDDVTAREYGFDELWKQPAAAAHALWEFTPWFKFRNCETWIRQGSAYPWNIQVTVWEIIPRLWQDEGDQA